MYRDILGGSISGSTCVTATTGAYVQVAGLAQINVVDSTSFLTGTDAILVSGANFIHGKISSSASGSVMFVPYAPILTGESPNGTVYAAGSLLSVVGAQGIQGPQGIQGIQGIQGANGGVVTTSLTQAYVIGTVSATRNVLSSTGLVIGSQLLISDGTSQVYVTLTAATATSITFTPGVSPSNTAPGATIAFGAIVTAAGALGATGAAGTNGTNGTNGKTPLSTTTASYTSIATPTSIAVLDSGAFAVGCNAVVTNAAGTARSSGTITAIADATHVTFAAQSPAPPGDSAIGTVYATGSNITVAGAQGATGATGSSATAVYNQVRFSDSSTTSTTPIQVGSTVTLVGTGVPVLFQFTGNVWNTTSNTVVSLQPALDGTAPTGIVSEWSYNALPSTGRSAAAISFIFTPTSGSHVYSIQMSAPTGTSNVTGRIVVQEVH